MSTLDNLFYKEFINSMRARASVKPLNINSIPIPKLTKVGNRVAKTNLVLTRGISDTYYSKLNDSESLLWSKPNLKRRKFGAGGKFLKDKAGNVLLEDVTLPRGSVAIVSQLKVGVPLKYTPKEDFGYVDYVTNPSTKEVHYIYIVPKNYCYKLNQTALVLSARPLRVYYEGISLYLQSGHQIYMYIVPYKPTNSDKPYRVLLSKTSIDFSAEINLLLDSWVRAGIIFNKRLTALEEPVRGRTNVAYQMLNPVLDSYYKCDFEKSLADTTTDISNLQG